MDVKVQIETNFAGMDDSEDKTYLQEALNQYEKRRDQGASSGVPSESELRDVVEVDAVEDRE